MSDHDATEKVTYCRICEPLCGMVATVEDGTVTKLRPDREQPLSRGFACPKGIAMTEVQNDPDRLLHPMRRGADGEFERVSWATALDEIGERLRRRLAAREPGRRPERQPARVLRARRPRAARRDGAPQRHPRADRARRASGAGRPDRRRGGGPRLTSLPWPRDCGSRAPRSRRSS